MRSPAVGLTFPGHGERAGVWSGIPSGLAAGLRELGVEPRHISVNPPALIGTPLLAGLAAIRMGRVDPGPPLDRLKRSRIAVSEGSRELAALRTRVAGRRVTRPALDAVVQMGTGYTVPDELPVATLEDATIEQAVRLGSPWWRAQDVATIAARIERQRRCYVQARACCTASRWAADSIVRDYAIAPEKVHVVGFGRNCDPRPVPRDWSRPRYLFVGREWERKGGHHLLRAFARVRARFPSAELELAGGHPRVDLPGVRSHGWIDATNPEGRHRLEELLQRATCFVMPSAFEPFGMAHVEAGAAGIPSIGTTVGGAAEAIGPEGGILVAPGDVGGLADAMLRLSSADVAVRMGAAACKRATWFTWPKVADRVLGALGLDLARRGVTRPGAGARA